MEKKRISVQIEGRSYALITSDEEKYVQSVADEISKRIRKAAQTGRQLDTRDCAILAALDLCDDRNKAQKRNKEIVGKADKIIQTTNELNRSCKEYKEKLTEAINENTKLVKQIKALEKQLEKLSKEKDEQIKALENEKDEQINALTKETDELKEQLFNAVTRAAEAAEAAKISDKPSKTAQEKNNEKLLGCVPMRQYSLFDKDNKKKNAKN